MGRCLEAEIYDTGMQNSNKALEAKKQDKVEVEELLAALEKKCAERCYH